MMNKSNTSFASGAFIFALVSFLITPVSAAIAGETVSGMVKTQVCGSFLAAEEKKKGKDGEGEEEPECE